MLVRLTLVLFATTALAACSTSGGGASSSSGGGGPTAGGTTAGGGATTGGGSAGGGTMGGGSTGGGSTNSGGTAGGGTSTGGGTTGSGIQLRGVTATFNKGVAATTPFNTIYEGATSNFASDDALASGPTTSTGSLTVSNPQIAASADLATVTASGGIDVTGAGGGAIGFPFGSERTKGDYAGTVLTDADSVGDRIQVLSYDTDGDGTDEFYGVMVHEGLQDVTNGQEQISAFYGGTFAVASDLAAKRTATYTKTNGAFIQLSQGAGLVNASPTTYNGDVNLTADFNAGTVNGTIALTSIGGSNGVDQVTLSNATISGVHYSGGSITLQDNGTTVSNFGTNQVLEGSFLGDGTAAGGAFMGAGTINGERGMVTGTFVAEE
ncbi:MAG: hypothetical protein AAGI92_09020 [Pseudomonadota bacterium]